MAVGYKRGDRPEDFGLPDWCHDADGKVNYSWYAPLVEREHPWPKTDFEEIAKRDQSYQEECTEEALDNMSWERHHRAERCNGFREWERNQVTYN